MTFLIAIAGLAVAVWGCVFLFRGSLLSGAVAFLVAGCCFNEYFVRFDVGPITLTLERLVLATLMATYVAQRWLGRADPKKLQNADILLAGFLGVLFVSLFTGESFRGLKGEVPPMWRFLAGYLMPAILYWIARQSRLTENRVYHVLAVLGCLGLYLSLTGMLEIAGQWALVFPRHIADPKLGLHFGRARGPMLQSVSFGTFVCAGLFATWLWRDRLNRWGRAAIWMSLPLFVAGVYFSYTRSVWMGLGLGLLIMAAFTLHKSWRPLVLTGMIGGAVMLAAFKSDAILGFQREYSASDTRDSASLRISFAYVSWQMFLDRPVLGVGLGRFAQEKLPYLADRSTEIPLERIRELVHHNHYLSLLTETGMIGLSLFLALLAVWAVDAWKIARHPGTPDWIRGIAVMLLAMIAMLLPQWLGHELSYSPIDHSLLFLLAGMTSGLRPQAFAEQNKPLTRLAGKSREGDVPQRLPVTPA